MGRKLVAIILGVVLVLALFSACSTDTSASSSEASVESEAATTEAEASAEASSTDESTSEAKTTGFKVGFANAYVGNTWREQFIDQITEEFEKYKEEGIISEYQVANSNNNVTDQMNQINSMINSGFDAIIIDPASTTALSSVIENAVSAGILVVIDDDAAAYDNTYSIGQDIANMQTIIGKWTAIQMGGEGNYVYISGLAGNPTDSVRTEALAAVMAEYPDITELATAPGSWSQTEAQSVMSTFLQTYGDDIDAVISQDIMSEGVLQAYSNAGMEPKIITGDCTKSFLKLWTGEYAGLEAIAVPAVTDVGAWGVDFTIGLLQGRTVDESILVGNPTDESVVNMIELPVPYCIVPEEYQSQEFLDFMASDFPNTKIMTPDEAMTAAADMDDTDIVGYTLTDEDLDRIFN